MGFTTSSLFASTTEIFGEFFNNEIVRAILPYVILPIFGCLIFGFFYRILKK